MKKIIALYFSVKAYSNTIRFFKRLALYCRSWMGITLPVLYSQVSSMSLVELSVQLLVLVSA